MIRYTNVPSGTSVLIANGETIEVTKMVIMSFFGTGNVTLFERDQTTVIASINQRTTNGFSPTLEMSTNWLADKGLYITVGGTVFFTIFYNHGAA